MLRQLLLIALGVCLVAPFGQRSAVSRQLANIVGPADERTPIFRSFTALGLSFEEMMTIRKAVGYVTCGDKAATGFLVSPTVVVTVAHIFADRNGVALGSPAGCYFEGQGPNAGRISLFSSKKSEYFFGTTRWLEGDEKYKDVAVLTLDKPVENAAWLKVISTPGDYSNAQILAVSAYRGDAYIAPGELRSEPLGQLCRIRRVIDHTQGVMSLYSDCDNTEGGSGGPNLVRTANKELAVAAIFSLAGKAPDRTPYLESQTASSLAVSLVLDRKRYPIPFQ